jgi:hypothetical protein
MVVSGYVPIVGHIGKDKVMEDYCCNRGVPIYMTVYRSHMAGNLAAKCERCTTIWGYWECACELAHDCELVKG